MFFYGDEGISHRKNLCILNKKDATLSRLTKRFVQNKINVYIHFAYGNIVQSDRYKEEKR